VRSSPPPPPPRPPGFGIQRPPLEGEDAMAAIGAARRASVGKAFGIEHGIVALLPAPLLTRFLPTTAGRASWFDIESSSRRRLLLRCRACLAC
jgi:hypothetical protein